MKNQKSTQLFKNAQKVIPGGVNSPVRAFKSVAADPIFIQKAKGPYLYDEDGNRYIDYCLSWGPMILGHANIFVLSGVEKAMSKGTSYGIPTVGETQLAEMIVSAFASIDEVRLVSSGTEAVMTAIRLARGATGRDKVIKFIGGYHGHVDHMLVSAGSGLMTLGSPSSPGVPADFAKHTLLAPYNNPEAVMELFKEYADQIAAVIVEPIAGNMGTVLPKPFFLNELRTLCNQHKSILIFDEVISGFRLCYGGAQTEYEIEPNLTTLGKIIGGGLPIGAVGGRANIMDKLAPDGDIYQAGTLSGNPVCVAAGMATLKQLTKLKPYDKLDTLTKHLCNGISEQLDKKGIDHKINRIGSMFTLFFTDTEVTDFDTASRCDTERYSSYFRQMLDKGIYLPPSQFETNFLSAAHTEKHIKKTIKAVKKVEF